MMRKLHCILVLLLLSAANLFGQTAARTTIKGVLCDTAGISVPSAVVLLLATKDSAFLNFAQTDEKGAFEFRNVKNSGYLLKIQHMSYIPYQKLVPISTGDLTDLGKIKLKVIAKVLREVVIQAAKAPLKFYGDTIEYDATAFKVPPGSTVEDLLRRLPGVDVDVAGNIKAQGKDVKRLYVEGKTFFGDDPLMATKNLGAEIVSKVQFFDEKSDRERITGIKDMPSNTKAMNLSLKEEFKHGAFGKATVAAGDQDRKVFRGNYNRFDKKQMLSFIGFANNINETGINSWDIMDYVGQTIATSNMGDYGTGSRFMYIDNSSGRFGGNDSGGLTDTYGSGINYNLDNKKTRISSSYNYKENTRTFFQTSKKETFYQNGSFKNADTTQSKDFVGDHYVELCLEQTIDTANTLTAKTYIHFTTLKGNSAKTSLFSDANDIKDQTLTTLNDNKLSSWRINSGVIYNHRFKKKGVNFSWNGGFNSVKSNGWDHPFSLNRFFEAQTFTDQVTALNANNNNTTTQFKSGMNLTKSLKNTNITVYYNFNSTNTIQDKLTQNSAFQNVRIDSLTAYYSNDALLNSIGTRIFYNYKGFQTIIEGAAQQIQLKGNYSLRNNTPDLTDPMNRSYSNLLPSVWFHYMISKKSSLIGSYSENINIPSMNQLMPIGNINNPSLIIEGNPDLQPSRSHDYSLYYSSYNQASMLSIDFGVKYGETKNSISNSQTINMIDQIGFQVITRPENMKGFANRTGFSANLSFPLIKKKLTMRMNGSLDYGTSPTFINEIENVGKNTSTSFATTFNLTLSQKLLFGLSGDMTSNDMRYSIQNNQNQKIKRYSSNSTVKWEIATKTYFDCNFNYSVYKNTSLGFDRNVPLLNASIRQLFGKANKIEMRFSAYDIFNKNLNISQTVTESYLLSSVANTLARYFMISFSYNIRGYDLKRY
jgi:hypothetical protein